MAYRVMSTSLRGLAQAMGMNPQGEPAPVFDPNTDPLGVGLMARARQHQFEDTVANPMNHVVGPLPDPKWDAYFEALRGVVQGRNVKIAGPRNQPGTV